MVKGLIAAVIGVVCFIAVSKLTASTILTGTDIGTTIITSLLGLVVAIAVVIVVLQTFLKGTGAG
jgi:hypothetical protein